MKGLLQLSFELRRSFCINCILEATIVDVSSPASTVYMHFHDFFAAHEQNTPDATCGVYCE